MQLWKNEKYDSEFMDHDPIVELKSNDYEAYVTKVTFVTSVNWDIQCLVFKVFQAVGLSIEKLIL